VRAEPQAIRGRSRRGYLHRPHVGVWAVGHSNLPLEGRLLAAVKACGPTARLSHLSAAWLWGFLDSLDRKPEVTVLGGATRVRPGIVVHRTAEVFPGDVTMFKGIPVTTPARTVLDVAATRHGPALRHLVRRAQGTRRISARQLAEVCRRLGPRRGSRRLAVIIAAGEAPTRTVIRERRPRSHPHRWARPPRCQQAPVRAGSSASP
jgi:hypothetical protein